MEIQQYDTAQGFLKKMKGFLLRREAVNNLPLGILYHLATETEEYKDSNRERSFLAVVESERVPVLAMVMTPPKNLIISGEGDNVYKAIQSAVSFLKETDWQVPGVIGERNQAEAFAEEWTKQNGCTPMVQMKQRIYRLDKVGSVVKSPGRLRLATMSDLVIVSNWIHAFSRETIESLNTEEAHKLAKEKIRHSSIFVWEDQKIVSMAGKSRSTENGATVSMVYTPPEYRQKGYASSCVATSSQWLLNEGYQFCSLYTDLANKTSNKIYMKMGYRPVADSIVYQF